MVYAGVFLIILVFAVSVTVYILCIRPERRAGYVVIPVFDDTDREGLVRLLKSTYYEETFDGIADAREIIIVSFLNSDKDFEIPEGLVGVSVIKAEELSEYIYKKEIINEEKKSERAC